MVGRKVPNIQVVSPLIRPKVAGAPPLKGTWIILTFAIEPNDAPARCVEAPTPPEPYVISPGRDLARAINCGTDFTGRDGWTTARFGAFAIRISGSKALWGSYGSFFLSV